MLDPLPFRVTKGNGIARLHCFNTIYIIFFMCLRRGAVFDGCGTRHFNGICRVSGRAYEQSARVGQVSRLEADVHDLLRVADPGATSALIISGDATDHRLMTPHSGLYAQVTSDDSRIIWRSPSLVGHKLVFRTGLVPSETVFYQTASQAFNDDETEKVFALSMGVAWVDATGEERAYTFSVAESHEIFDAQIREFRASLWFWFTGLTCVLLCVQALILRWGLSPVRRLGHELTLIEKGHKELLEGEYPHELMGLVDDLNALVQHERTRQARYSHAMSDLAHSLKTPLAVLRGVTSNELPKDVRTTITAQVDRLDQIARYQLKRVTTSGQSRFTKPVSVRPVINKIISALDKVYALREVTCHREIKVKTLFYGDEGDLMELLGNLLDNAYKYGDGKVWVSAANEATGTLILTVSNNGQDIPEEARQTIMQRGERVDSKQEGQGIGLAVVNDIVTAYGGDIRVSSLDGGGAIFELLFPR